MQLLIGLDEQNLLNKKVFKVQLSGHTDRYPWVFIDGCDFLCSVSLDNLFDSRESLALRSMGGQTHW